MIIVTAVFPFDRNVEIKLWNWQNKWPLRVVTNKAGKSYEFYVGLADPDTLMLFQEWESMEALMEHFDTAHMDDFLQRLPDLVSGEIVTRRYAVQMMDEEQPLGELLRPSRSFTKRVWHCRIKRLRSVV